MILAVLTVSVLLAAAVSAAHYKVIPGNLIKGGDFNSSDVADYFWMDPNDTPYRGASCTWQKDGGVGNSGCIKMSASTDIRAIPALCSRNQKGEPMFPQITEGKKYVAMIDVYRPAGVDATIQWDAENGCGLGYNRAQKNGEWERLVGIWTADRSGDCYLRIFNAEGDGNVLLKGDDYILIDNFYFAEYKEGVNYTEMVNDGTPATGDNAAVISAVVAAAALAGVCVVAGKKKTR